MAIELEAFCAKEWEPRKFLHRPWSFRQFSYAANGHICVRVPRRPDVPESPEKMAEGVTRLGFGRAVQFTPLVAPVPDVDGGVCGVCAGSGQVADSPECHTCGGAGKGRVAITIRRAIFDLRYVRRLLGLPGLAMETRPPDALSSGVLFRFDGGHVLLMRMSGAREGEPHIVLDEGAAA